MSFTDKLIEEHLNSAERADTPQYVARDPKAFRKFVTRPDKTHLQSQFTNFYTSEALKQTQVHELYTEVQGLEKDLLRENTVAEEAEIKNKI